MRGIDLSDLRNPGEFVLRDDDVSINDAHPVVPTENVKAFFHRCKLIEHSAAAIKRITEMDMTVVLLREMDCLVILNRRDDHELAEELPIVRKRQSEDVSVVDADGDASGVDCCHSLNSAEDCF